MICTLIFPLQHCTPKLDQGTVTIGMGEKK